MKKLLVFFIKLLPFITLYKGLTSGGKQISPLFDVGRTAFTQYELTHITKEVINYYQETHGKILHPKELSRFINKRYYNNYSKLLRKFFAKQDPDDLSLDLWGQPFVMEVKDNASQIIVKSSGPDGELSTKDDITIDFRIKGNSADQDSIHVGSHQQTPQSRQQSDNDPYGNNDYVDDDGYYEDGYDRDGFDRDGYDRDGYDREGVHRSER